MQYIKTVLGRIAALLILYLGVFVWIKHDLASWTVLAAQYDRSPGCVTASMRSSSGLDACRRSPGEVIDKTVIYGRRASNTYELTVSSAKASVPSMPLQVSQAFYDAVPQDAKVGLTFWRGNVVQINYDDQTAGTQFNPDQKVAQERRFIQTTIPALAIGIIFCFFGVKKRGPSGAAVI